jgi:hypothetical protein
MEPYIIIPAIVAAIAVIAFLSWRHEKKRTQAMEDFARSLRFSFAGKGDPSLVSSLSRFRLFSQGHARRATNVMAGSADDIDVTMMDYRYTTGGGRSSHTWRQTAVLFHSGLLQLPAFVLRPESMFHRIGSAFGYQDIDFDSHPTFSKQYLLQGADEEAVRSIFGEGLLAYCEEHKGVSAEGDGDRLLFYRISRRVPPKDMRAFMEEGFGLFSLVKTES